jgi:hypothetical protein
MNMLIDNKIQNGTYWSGFLLGALTTSLLFLVIGKLSTDQGAYPPGLIPQDIVKAYNMGLKDSLRTNPPSMELDATCLELWTERQPGVTK